MTTLSGAQTARPYTDFTCAAPGSVITLDVPPVMGEEHAVADCQNGAATSPITVLPPAGGTISGQPSYVLSIGGQVGEFKWTPLGWVSR